MVEQGFEFAAGVLIFFVVVCIGGTWAAMLLSGVWDGITWLNDWMFGAKNKAPGRK